MALNILLVIVAYLLGSIPSAVWIGKRFYGIDVREHGSHNAGATNTLRTLGKIKRQGRYAGRTPEIKKAYVTLKKDSKTIEFFDGMAQ